MTTLPNMGLVLPTRGPAGSGLWDDTVDDDLGKIDAHDHTADKGARIRTAAMQIDADLSFGSQWGATNLQRIQFAAVDALSNGGRALFVSGADNELYWRSNGGTNVKLTLGNALNVAAFTGGIGGDYAAVGALVAFEDSNDRYTFKQQGALWARMASGEVRIFETGTNETVFVGLAAPTALAASYTITLPLALPAGPRLLLLDNTGQLIVLATALPGAQSIMQITPAGAIVFSNAMAANQSLVFSGTGLPKHGQFSITHRANIFDINQASGTPVTQTAGSAGINIPATCDVHIPLPSLPVYARILFVTLHLSTAINAGSAFSISQNPAAGSGAAFSTFGAFSAGVGSTATPVISAVGGTAMNLQEVAGRALYVRYSNTGGSAFTIMAIQVDYDIP